MTPLLRNLFWVFLAACATATCQILAKTGVAQLGELHPIEHPFRTLYSIATNFYIALGLAIQVFGFTIWLTVIARSNLTWAVSAASALTLIVTAALNSLVLGSKVTGLQALGIAVLICGIALLSFEPQTR